VLEDSYHLVTVDRQRGLVGRRAAAFVSTLLAERSLLPAAERIANAL
jgi:hypothetical protein